MQDCSLSVTPGLFLCDLEPDDRPTLKSEIMAEWEGFVE
jgi:hypothetical protein